MKRLALILAVVGILGTPPAALHSQGKVATRHMLVKWAGQVPTLSFNARDFANRDVVRKLRTGLPQTIVTRVYAYPEKGKKPISVAALSCRVIYDLWADTYRIEVQREEGTRSLSARDVGGVMQSCLDFRKLGFGKPGRFAKHRGGKVYFAAIVEFNPLSAGTVKRIRRWLARPGGEALEGDAFFGSFVSIFVTRGMGTAEKTLSFRSALFGVPP